MCKPLVMYIHNIVTAYQGGGADDDDYGSFFSWGVKNKDYSLMWGRKKTGQGPVKYFFGRVSWLAVYRFRFYLDHRTSVFLGGRTGNEQNGKGKEHGKCHQSILHNWIFCLITVIDCNYFTNISHGRGIFNQGGAGNVKIPLKLLVFFP